MYDSILVPTDGSDHAERAFERGLTLSEGFGGELHLQHVVETSRFGSPTMSGSALLVDQQEDDGQRVLKRLAGVAADRDVPVTTRNCHGDPCDEILGYARDNDIDVVVLGYQGEDHERSIGNTANRVVKALDRPVMLV